MIITLNLDLVITDRHGGAMRTPSDGELKLSDALYEAIMAPVPAVGPDALPAKTLQEQTKLSDRVTQKGEHQFDEATLDRIETMCEKRWAPSSMQVLKRIYEIFNSARAEATAAADAVATAAAVPTAEPAGEAAG